MYVPKSRGSKYERQRLIQQRGEIDKYSIIIEGFKTSVSVTEEQAGRKSTSV